MAVQALESSSGLRDVLKECSLHQWLKAKGIRGKCHPHGVTVSLSRPAQLMGFVFTLLAPGWKHREDLCQEIFLDGISGLLDKDWGHCDQSVSQDCPPLVKDAQESYFSGDACDRQDYGEKRYFSRIILFLLLSFTPSCIP